MKQYTKEQIDRINELLFQIENNYLNPSKKFLEIRQILLLPAEPPPLATGFVITVYPDHTAEMGKAKLLLSPFDYNNYVQINQTNTNT